MSDASDHYGTLTRISGVNKDIDDQDIYVRKSKLSPKEWERFSAHLNYILNQSANLGQFLC